MDDTLRERITDAKDAMDAISEAEVEGIGPNFQREFESLLYRMVCILDGSYNDRERTGR